MERKHAIYTPAEQRLFARLTSPAKIQNYLNSLAPNFEIRGETLRSPRRVICDRTAHCLEGALLAAAALEFHGGRPLLLDLKTGPGDDDHVVAPFRIRGFWGAISKTNHAVLRYREPVYRTVRELALSYFHEYFLDSGRKTLRSYSDPFDLRKLRREWRTESRDMWWISRALDRSRHVAIAPRAVFRSLRSADPIEITAGKLVVVQDPRGRKKGRKE